MRKLLAVIGLLGLVGFAPAAAAQDDKGAAASKTCVLKVSGMSCDACVNTVEKTALKIDGVRKAKIDRPKGTAEIVYDPARTSPEKIAKVITDKSGFQAEAPPKAAKK